MWRLLVLAGGCLMMCSSASARHVKAFVCEFVGRHSATMAPSYQTGNNGDKLSTTFASIDIKNSSAQMVGSAGAVDVMLVAPGNQMQFIEFTPVGNVAVTSVFMTIPSPDGSYPAVHSRHMMILKSAVVSQYAGACSPRR